MTEYPLLALIIVHMLCDYPLQGDFLAKAKNPLTPLPGVPWWQAMTAHGLIHAGGVWLVTGSVGAGVLEFTAHIFIDYGKCRGWISFNTDQALHIACKVLWVALLAHGVL